MKFLTCLFLISGKQYKGYEKDGAHAHRNLYDKYAPEKNGDQEEAEGKTESIFLDNKCEISIETFFHSCLRSTKFEISTPLVSHFRQAQV